MNYLLENVIPEKILQNFYFEIHVEIAMSHYFNI